MKPVVLSDYVTAFIAKHGSVRKAAEVVGITAPYLHRLASGEKINPSEETLFNLGLRAEVRYYRSPSGRIKKGTFK